MVGMRYAPTSFRHNARIGAVLLPTLVILVGFGGKLPVGVFLAGAMVSICLLSLPDRPENSAAALLPIVISACDYVVLLLS